MNSIVLKKSEDLALIEEFINRVVNKHPELEKKSSYLSIICDEIISNIFNNNETSVTIEVRLELVNNEVSLNFIDNGKLFDPTHYEPSAITDGNIERPIGGLGISIVKKIADAVYYKTVEEKNHLTIKITV